MQSKIKYMVLFLSYNLLTLDLSSEAMLQDEKILGTHLAR